MRNAERCCICDEPTGRAGRGEDSIYCERCEAGPFCENCLEGNHICNPDDVALMERAELDDRRTHSGARA